MQDLEFLIEKAVDHNKADYAVVAGVQVRLLGRESLHPACRFVSSDGTENGPNP